MLAPALSALYPRVEVSTTLLYVTESDWNEMQIWRAAPSTKLALPLKSRLSPSPFGKALRIRASHEGGASAIEFALVIPVLLLLLFGIIEFGVIFQNQLAITHAAREGARMAAVGQWDDAVVKSRAFPVDPTVVVSPSSPNTATRGTAVTVTLTYVYDWTFLPFPGTIQLQSEAVMRRE